MSSMTSTERVMAAAMGQEPDRVPVFGVFLDYAWAQLYGKNSFMDYCLDPEKTAKAMVWICKEMECDIVATLPDVHMTEEGIAEASGMAFPMARWADFCFTDPHRLYEGDPIKETAYGDPLIKTMEDAERLVPADPYKHGRTPVLLKAIELARKELGPDYVIGGMCENPFAVGGMLMGWTQVLMVMQDNLPLWKKVEDILIKTSYAYSVAQIKAGVNVLLSHSELPQRIGSKAFLENPVWVQADHPPELMKRLGEEFNIDVGLHPCTAGPWEQGIEAWQTMLDHTHSFLIPEYGGADALARAKEKLAPAMVMGNINPIDVMLLGTPSDVEEACVELIHKCAPGGRFVLAPGCMISLDVPFENLKAMVNSVKKFGNYPIRS